MKTASAKAKGRRAALEVRTSILNVFPELDASDINVTSSGAGGRDLTLSPKARAYVPFVFEVKNQEKLNVWDAVKQAKGHCHENEAWALCFKRNHSPMLCVIEFEELLAICRMLKDEHI